MTPTQRLLDAAQRLVAEADFRLGGILSNESKARDIPSTAYSQVKARHLASLRDALCAALAEQPAEQAYPLPDALYPGSKDWVHGTYADRVEWLHTMYESAKRLNDALAEQPAEQEPITKETYLQELLAFMNANDPSRWEIGFRNIVSILLGPKSSFEIADVVEMVRQLKQPAEQEPVAQRWQPIETAPKGRIVLVYYKNSLGNGRTMRARYYLPETLDSDTTESGWADEGWYEESEAYEYLMPLEHDPTHWMPLPAGPDTAPQPAKRVPLTDEEITAHFRTNVDTGSLLSFVDGVRFAERAHGITGGTE